MPACAASYDGSLAFEGGAFAQSCVAAPGDGGDATSVPAVDVLPRLSDADLLKVDIEGAEWAILADPRFRSSRVPAIVLEYHSHLCPADDPGALAERLLDGAGYATETIFDRGDGVGMLWAYRAAGAGDAEQAVDVP